MLNLEAIPEEEFCVPVKPIAPRPTMQLIIHEQGIVTLNGKLAEKFANRPVQICFNKARTAVQITCVEKGNPLGITFPKNGRKKLVNAYELLQEQVAFPAVFQNNTPIENDKWRGALAPNPMQSSLHATQSKKKK